MLTKFETLTGDLRPYVVYMLPDMEIIEDWTAIKKALKQAEKHENKKKKDCKYIALEGYNILFCIVDAYIYFQKFFLIISLILSLRIIESEVSFLLF